VLLFFVLCSFFNTPLNKSTKRTSSSFSSIGANSYTQNHHQNEVSSTIKLNQTTSDYYSNSSKHDEG
jgi:hypothetical protein